MKKCAYRYHAPFSIPFAKTQIITQGRESNPAQAVLPLLRNQAPSGRALCTVIHTGRFPKGIHVSAGKFLVAPNPQLISVVWLKIVGKLARAEKSGNTK